MSDRKELEKKLVRELRSKLAPYVDSKNSSRLWTQIQDIVTECLEEASKELPPWEPEIEAQIVFDSMGNCEIHFQNRARGENFH